MVSDNFKPSKTGATAIRRWGGGGLWCGGEGSGGRKGRGRGGGGGREGCLYIIKYIHNK